MSFRPWLGHGRIDIACENSCNWAQTALAETVNVSAAQRGVACSATQRTSPLRRATDESGGNIQVGGVFRESAGPRLQALGVKSAARSGDRCSAVSCRRPVILEEGKPSPFRIAIDILQAACISYFWNFAEYSGFRNSQYMPSMMPAKTEFSFPHMNVVQGD